MAQKFISNLRKNFLPGVKNLPNRLVAGIINLSKWIKNLPSRLVAGIKELPGKWKISLLWFSWMELRLIFLGTVAIIKRSIVPAIKMSAVAGTIFSLILIPFSSITSLILQLNPDLLFLSGIYVSEPYQERIYSVVGSEYLGIPIIAVLMFVLFFASYIIPVLIIRTSREAKDLNYVKTHLLPALVVWPFLLGLNILIINFGSFVDSFFRPLELLFNYGLVPLGNVIPLFGAIPHGLIAQSWFMALRLNMAFFFLDLITGHKFAESVIGSIKNTFLASIYFTPIFLLPWTSIIGLIYEACALILSWPASYLPTSISYDAMIDAIKTSPPLIKNIFIWSTPICAIILAATLNIISFSFYSTIYLKMKHGNQKFFFGKLK